MCFTNFAHDFSVPGAGGIVAIQPHSHSHSVKTGSSAQRISYHGTLFEYPEFVYPEFAYPQLAYLQFVCSQFVSPNIFPNEIYALNLSRPTI